MKPSPSPNPPIQLELALSVSDACYWGQDDGPKQDDIIMLYVAPEAILIQAKHLYMNPLAYTLETKGAI